MDKEVISEAQCKATLNSVADAFYVIGGNSKLRIIVALTEADRRFNECNELIKDYFYSMNIAIQEIQEAAAGLMFISESDFPFEAIHLAPRSSIETELLQLVNKPAGTVVEKTTLDYFFRNMTRIDPNASSQQQSTARRFKQLHEILKTKLTDVQVWRIGTIQIDAFIIGRLSDGSYAGLRTKLIET
jgi:hypothetical protein